MAATKISRLNGLFDTLHSVSSNCMSSTCSLNSGDSDMHLSPARLTVSNIVGSLIKGTTHDIIHHSLILNRPYKFLT